MSTPVERSVDNLQRLYGFVIGFALAEAVARFVLGPSYRTTAVTLSTRLYYAEYLPTMIAFLVTLVPFYHGANRYLDHTYILGRVRPPRFALLIDFLVLFFEGLIFYWMALRLDEWVVFFSAFMLLIIVDILWVMIIFLYSHTFQLIWKWGLINLVGLALMWAIAKTPLIEEAAKPEGLVALAVLRTIVDYAWNWKFFYPDDGTAEAPMGVMTKQ